MRTAKWWLGIPVLLAASPPVWAQTTEVALSARSGPPIPFVEEFAFDGGVAEWRARPVDRILHPTIVTPQVLLWVGQVEEGLAVAAELRPTVDATGDPEAIPPLIVSVSGPSDPVLPPIGWGHQFGSEILADSTGCVDVADGVAGCFEWHRRQIRSRERLPALFQRTWRLDLHGGQPAEIGAASAFLAIGAPERLAPLAPRGRARTLTREIRGTPDGVGLELLIPWSAFPPVRAPDLDAVRIHVDWEADAPAAVLSLAPPRPLGLPLTHHVTPCRSGLSGVLVPGDPDQRPRPATEGAVVYMIPDPSGDLRRLIILDNHAEGYQYGPNPDALSPQAFETTFDVLDVGGDRRLCAPTLALADGNGRLSPEDWTSTGEGDPWGRHAELRDLQVRTLDDGSLLALSGPSVFWSYYGSGQCGACPRVSVEVFHLDVETGEIHTVLRHLDLVEPGVHDIEIEVTADWSEITVYQSEMVVGATPGAARWSSTRHCRREAATGPPIYEVCGEEEDVPEPPFNLRGRYSER